LSHNNIRAIDDLQQHPFLECLLLSNNKISSVNGLGSLKYLQVLFLHFAN